MSWIRTRTGRRFYPLSPKAEDIHIEDIAHALSHQCRFAGHTFEFYCVAQHCVHVADLLKEWGHPPDVQLAGLMHDATEAYLTDVPTPVKKVMDGYKAAEAALDVLVREKFGLGDHDEIVKRADMAAFAMEVRDLMGNPTDWESTRGTHPEKWEIIPWQPVVAKSRFLERYRRLAVEVMPQNYGKGGVDDWQVRQIHSL